MTSATLVSGCTINLSFLRNEIRVEFLLNRPNPAENKWMFDQLQRGQEAFEAKLDRELEWRRLDDNRKSDIVCRKPVEGYNRENWPEMIEWLCETYRQVFSQPVRELAVQLQTAAPD